MLECAHGEARIECERTMDVACYQPRAVAFARPPAATRVGSYYIDWQTSDHGEVPRGFTIYGWLFLKSCSQQVRTYTFKTKRLEGDREGHTALIPVGGIVVSKFWSFKHTFGFRTNQVLLRQMI